VGLLVVLSVEGDMTGVIAIYIGHFEPSFMYD